MMSKPTNVMVATISTLWERISPALFKPESHWKVIAKPLKRMLSSPGVVVSKFEAGASWRPANSEPLFGLIEFSYK
jgi:hypothetical protein